MRYVNLGGCGLKVSQIGLGMMSYGDPASQQWALNEDRAEPIVRQAVEAGVTFFDTADMYSDGASEEITGRLLGRLFPRRDDFVLATKVYYPTGPGANDRGLSRKHILTSIEGSLKRRAADFGVADAVAAVASQRNLPAAQIALAWLLGRPGVSAPIVGATKPGHLVDATEALDVSLSADEVAQLESRYLPRG